MRIVQTYTDSGKSGLNLKGRGGLQATTCFSLPDTRFG